MFDFSELEDTYLFVHERLESLVDAVLNYEDMASVISISNEIGRAVAQTSLFTFPFHFNRKNKARGFYFL